ncbi:MAG: putative copper-importing P-type ATPase A [Hyphomicrobiaceae bacterium hypho_1]
MFPKVPTLITSASKISKGSLDDERLRVASRVIDNETLQTDFYLPDMHCAGCVMRIERELGKLEGVLSARANLTLRRVAIVWKHFETNASTLSAELDKLGFKHIPLQHGSLSVDDDSDSLQQLLLCLGVAGFGAANIMLLSISVWSGADAETRQLFHLVSGLVAIPTAIFSGRPFFLSAFNSLSYARLNMDVPISLAIVLALAISIWESLNGGLHAYFDAALMLLFFLLIGRTLDHMMRTRARNAVKLLSSMAAKGAVRIRDNEDQEYVQAEQIIPGDRLQISPGERVPVDGVVLGEGSDIDRSLVTGESVSVFVQNGEAIEAGTLNLTRPLIIEALKTAHKSFLAEVLHMMEAAESGKAKYMRIADRAAAIYAPAVHILALCAFIGWIIVSNGNWHMSIYIAVSVLIITCPCALGLAVPIVHVVGAGRLFDEGILIKDGSGFERLSEIDTVVFDKTGTLTKGEFNVIETHATSVQLAQAIALAQTSRHPAARAVANLHSHSSSHVTSKLSEVREYPGLGIEASCEGRRVRLGRPSWVKNIVGNSPELAENISMTTLWFAEEANSVATFTMTDELRVAAAETIKKLQASKLDIHILSGDNQEVVHQVANQLGITTFFAEQRPADKIAYIQNLQARGCRVLMIGDGLNDAPALSAAHASMAPSSGSDVGRQAADFVLTNVRLSGVAFAHDIAKRTGRLVKQNIIIAILYNCIAVPLACLGLVTPLVAAVSMSGSSVLVVANSMRLHFTRSTLSTKKEVNP